MLQTLASEADLSAYDEIAGISTVLFFRALMPELRLQVERRATGATATTWLRAGVPLGEVARRLGHSVETLVSTYVGALQGDDVAANKLIDAALSTTRESIVEEVRRSPRVLPVGEGQYPAETGHQRSSRARR